MPLLVTKRRLSLLLSSALLTAGSGQAEPLPSTAATDTPLAVETFANAPIKAFNELVNEAHGRHEHWVTNAVSVARLFAGDDPLMTITPQQSTSRTASYLLRQQLSEQGVAELLYRLELQQSNGYWQITNADLAWRCQGSALFSIRACPSP